MFGAQKFPDADRLASSDGLGSAQNHLHIVSIGFARLLDRLVSPEPPKPAGCRQPGEPSPPFFAPLSQAKGRSPNRPFVFARAAAIR